MSDEPEFRHVIFGESVDDPPDPDVTPPEGAASTGGRAPDEVEHEPGDDDLDDDLDDDFDLPPLKPRRRIGLTTSLLAGVVVLTAGFLVGVLVQRHYGGASSGSAANGSTASAARRFGTQLGSRGATVGQVTTVDGTTLYVTTLQGDTVKVDTSGATTVTKPSTVSIDAVNPGDTVIVQAVRQPDGSYQASQVSISGSGGGGFGGGGFGGGGAGGGGGPSAALGG
jgi:hypothetical protein